MTRSLPTATPSFQRWFLPAREFARTIAQACGFGVSAPLAGSYNLKFLHRFCRGGQPSTQFDTSRLSRLKIAYVARPTEKSC